MDSVRLLILESGVLQYWYLVIPAMFLMRAIAQIRKA